MTEPPPPAFARAVWAIVAAKLVLHALTSARGYGYFGDELYYLACAHRLGWGYVDHPPLSIALLAGWTQLFGESLAAIRMAAALIGAGCVALAGQLARELGGGARAQVLTALVVALAPVNLVVHGYFSMNAIDILVWLVAFIVIARLVRDPSPKLWLGLGVVFGVGLMNKFSLLWLGAGLGVGLLATPHRRLLASPWPWIAAALALALFAPHLVWQAVNGFPTLEFMAAATGQKMLPVGPVDLLGQQALVMLPFALPLWVAGLVLLFRNDVPSNDPRGPGRVFALIFVTVFVILAVNGTSRPNYLALAMPPLVAAGAIGVEALGRRPRLRALPAVAIGLVAVGGLLMSVMSIPVLAPADVAALGQAIGIGAPKMENREIGALDPHFADMIGWETRVDAVARVWSSLSADEQARATIVAPSYVEAGAIELFGPARGLPTPVSPQNSYWLWGPGSEDATVFVIMAREPGDWARHFESVEAAGTFDCGLCMPARNHLTIFIARNPRLPVAELWAGLRRYI